jgi:predicted house-cleaning noncanonical NTP pyrophosphatase (MazG superfamily)
MPIFEFNKLVRDKLREEYKRTGQKATYRKLSAAEYKKQLINKIAEELVEIDINSEGSEIIGELGDIKQVVMDFMKACDIGDDQVEAARQAKFDKKGGFEGRTYVMSLELNSEDKKWIEYYRKRPDVFKET